MKRGKARTIILDPKYRVANTSVKQALGEMHKYKDAIVDEKLNRIVRAAYILTPDLPQGEDNIKRYLQPEYKLKHGLGVCVLKPGDDKGLEELWGLIV